MRVRVREREREKKRMRKRDKWEREKMCSPESSLPKRERKILLLFILYLSIIHMAEVYHIHCLSWLMQREYYYYSYYSFSLLWFILSCLESTWEKETSIKRRGENVVLFYKFMILLLYYFWERERKRSDLSVHITPYITYLIIKRVLWEEAPRLCSDHLQRGNMSIIMLCLPYILEAESVLRDFERVRNEWFYYYYYYYIIIIIIHMSCLATQESLCSMRFLRENLQKCLVCTLDLMSKSACSWVPPEKCRWLQRPLWESLYYVYIVYYAHIEKICLLEREREPERPRKRGERARKECL